MDLDAEQTYTTGSPKPMKSNCIILIYGLVLTTFTG